MSQTKLMKAWQKDLGAELGAPLERLAALVDEPWLSADLLLDSQGSDRPVSLAQQKRLGLYVLGRTSQGVFGVSRDTSDAPVAERPISFAAFSLASAAVVAPDLHTFLTTHPSLREVREPMTAALGSAKTSTKAKKAPAPSSAPKSSTPKLTLAERKQLAADRVKRFLKEGPKALALLVDLEEVESAGTRLEIVLGTQLPASLEGTFEHPVLTAVEEGVKAAVREQVGEAVVRYEFIGDAALGSLRSLVTKCPGETADALALIDAAERAAKRSKRS